jgi:hypothetical protein
VENDMYEFANALVEITCESFEDNKDDAPKLRSQFPKILCMTNMGQ